MSFPLFKKMTKLQMKDILSYGIGAILYQWLIIWIYPSIANSGINDMIKSMPESMLKAFGMASGIHRLGDFLAGEFYGLLYLIIMMVFTLLTSIKLISRLNDRGSMVYLLATPVSRVRIVLTQVGVLVIGLVVIAFFTTIGGVTGALLFAEHTKLDTAMFIQMNLVGFLLFLLIGAYSFVFSCSMDDEKKAMGLAAGLTITFYAIDLVSKMNQKLDWLGNVTIFSLFDPQSIMNGGEHVLSVSIGLLIASIVLFTVSILIFKKRDLSL